MYTHRELVANNVIQVNKIPKYLSTCLDTTSKYLIYTTKHWELVANYVVPANKIPNYLHTSLDTTSKHLIYTTKHQARFSNNNLWAECWYLVCRVGYAHIPKRFCLSQSTVHHLLRLSPLFLLHLLKSMLSTTMKMTTSRRMSHLSKNKKGDDMVWWTMLLGH